MDDAKIRGGFAQRAPDDALVVDFIATLVGEVTNYGGGGETHCDECTSEANCVRIC